MSYLFLTYGSTHSGKTTFGKRLREALGEQAKFIHVDNDVADEFVKTNFNNLRTDKDILATRSPTNPDLRLLIPQLVVGYALAENYSVIATAAHPRRAIRESYYQIARSHNAQVVLLMFKADEAEIMQRIVAHNRDDGILDISPHGGATFKDLYAKQKQLLEEPTPEEREACHQIYEITPDNTDEILQTIVATIQAQDM